MLRGKGIWLSYSHDLMRALEMAGAIQATHLLVKVGHGPSYFPESARTTLQRVLNQGYTPLAWVYVTHTWAYEAVYVAEQALRLGYSGIVFWVPNFERFNGQLRRWADALTESQLDRRQLYLATPPLPHIAQPDAFRTIAPLCEGGWMPFCFPGYGPAPQVIGRDVYQTMDTLSLIWNRTPAVYPILTPLLLNAEGQALLPEAFIPWVEAIIQRGEDFFSVYHAAGVERVFWPLLATAGGEPEPPDAPEGTALPSSSSAQPLFVTVRPQDTVAAGSYVCGEESGLIASIDDDRGMPRDPDYMQAGWRVRVK